MKSVLKFDRFILTKAFDEKINKVGEAFEIANILDSGFLMRENKTKLAVGVVGFEDLEKYFTKEDEFTGWTEWTQLVGFDGQNDCFYRTNRRKVQVKFVTSKTKAESCCHKEDEFNLFFGVQTAYLRCRNKALSKKKVEYEQKLKEIKCEIAENNTIVRNMIDSLEV